MKTIEIQLYKFNELSEDAKQTAIENWRQTNYDTGDYPWLPEIRDSYKEIKEKVYDSLRDIEREITGKRLFAWIQNNLSVYWTDRIFFSKHINGEFKKSYFYYKYDCIKKKRSNILTVNNIDNCPFTGVCYDYDFLQPIIDFLKKPSANVSNTDLYGSMPSYESLADREIESQNSDEYIIDTIEANEYDFTENGEMY